MTYSKVVTSRWYRLRYIHNFELHRDEKIIDPYLHCTNFYWLCICCNPDVFLLCFWKCDILSATTCTILVSTEKIIVDFYHFFFSSFATELPDNYLAIWLVRQRLHIYFKKKKQQQQNQYIHQTIIVCHTSFGSYETSFVHFERWNEHIDFISIYEQSDRHFGRFQIEDPWKRGK